MAALAIFQPWIWVGVGIDKFLIDLGGKNISDTIITWCGSMLTSGWLAVSLHYTKGLNAVMD
jgi:TM2 domain-containing membrane protein YozV